MCHDRFLHKPFFTSQNNRTIAIDSERNLQSVEYCKITNQRSNFILKEQSVKEFIDEQIRFLLRMTGKILKKLRLIREKHHLNLLNPTGHVMHQQFNIQEL